MIACYIAVGQAQHAIERTVDYLRQRVVFGRPLIENQAIQFELARLVADVEALRQTNHACAEAYLAGDDTTRLATIAKSLAGPAPAEGSRHLPAVPRRHRVHGRDVDGPVLP